MPGNTVKIKNPRAGRVRTFNKHHLPLMKEVYFYFMEKNMNEIKNKEENPISNSKLRIQLKPQEQK
jgi:hypothetical protein